MGPARKTVHRPLRLTSVVVLAVLLVLTTAALAFARPGGGSSFSSGSHSIGSSSSHSVGSSSSSHFSTPPSFGNYGGGGGDGLGLLGWLLSSAFGTTGFFVFLVIVALVSYNAKKQRAALDWTAGIAAAAAVRRRIQTDLDRLRETDANFSPVLFEDFVYALYAHAHARRANGRIDQMSAFLADPARAMLDNLGPVREVRDVVIGAMRYVSVDGTDNASPAVAITLELETNYTDVPATGAPEQSYYAVERWVLCKNRGVLSRTPDRARVFTCPSCNAPVESVVAGRCSYCQAQVNTGSFDWVVTQIEIRGREARGPMLTGTTEEKGTDLPTISDASAQAKWQALATRDPQLNWPGLTSRVALIFQSMQVGWSNRDLTRARPFVTDNLFEMLSYWIGAYKKAALRNVTENAAIERIDLARVGLDKFYQAVTIRIFASSLDYTIADADGQVVGGSRARRRSYSEYWTLVRSAETTGPAKSDSACPSCGAPLDVEMAGTCKYCRAKVTSGQFDWVLSRIEQDDVYDG